MTDDQASGRIVGECSRNSFIQLASGTLAMTTIVNEIAPTMPNSRSETSISDAAATKIFWWLACLHCAIWSLVPCITQPNGSIDVIEMLYWGHEWQAGYYKHPPLPGWLAEASVMVCGRAIWPTYLLSQLCTLACFWSAFSVAKECVGRRGALLSVLLLEACYYYNYTTTDFNNNVASRAFWALTIAFLYRGLVQQKLWGWAAAGATLGLGMLAKYDTGVLAVTMGLFSIVHPLGRAAWKTRGPWLTLGISLTIFAPHLLWLVHNDFPTVTYFLQRSSSEKSWRDHLRYPLGFFAAQMGAFLPVCLLAWPLMGRVWRRRAVTNDLERHNRDFVLAFAFVPVLLIVVVGLFAGVRIRSMWGTALWSYLGVALVVLFQVRQDAAAIRREIRLAASFGLAAIGALLFHDLAMPSVMGKNARVHFPGRELARQVDQAFQKVTGSSPEIVGGPWWTAANVAFYMDRRATVYANMNPKISPWTSDAELERSGGVIVWPSELRDPDWESALRRRFPDLTEVAPVRVVPQAHSLSEALVFRVAIVPPARNFGADAYLTSQIRK